FKRGDVWTGEELVLQGKGDGSRGRWITVGAYGEGAKPRISDPPFDRTPGLVDWSAINRAYPGTNREFMKIAVKLAEESYGWKFQGLEISNAEMGLYIPGGSYFWIEDMYFHDILGLFMPETPDWDKTCEGPTGCIMWGTEHLAELGPFPRPGTGSAIVNVAGGNHFTVKDVVIERATGGIDGFADVALIENVFIDKTTAGGPNLLGHGTTVRATTVLNTQWPNGAWYGVDPIMLAGVTGYVVERSEFAYVDNRAESTADASPLDFDSTTVNSVVRDNFFHDNIGPCFENLYADTNRNNAVERNVCYNNGLGTDPGASYNKVAFSADACSTPIYFTIKDNLIYKAFPGQYLNHWLALRPEQTNDFALAQNTCAYTVSGNRIFESGQFSLPLPIPEPPAIGQTNLASSAQVTVSSGQGTAASAQDGSLTTEWVSSEGRPWIKYAWGSPQTIDRIRIFDRADLANWATSGILRFSDGSTVNVTGGILNNGAMREVVLEAPKTVTSVEFRVTRNVPESPGTNVGLTDFQVYEAGPPVPPEPAPDPGTFTVDFSDRPAGPTLLLGRYPDTKNGMDFGRADWTTRDGVLYADRPRYASDPATARIFILPAGKQLQRITIRCPAGATVAIFEAGQGFTSTSCTGQLTAVETGWTTPALSSVVQFWIDLTNTPGGNTSDVRFDDIVYGDPEE
ncbi:MAG: discoidin domain-containing protein, partial [bacterium]|nr:discoidin domain-containing protein [bacterium]